MSDASERETKQRPGYMYDPAAPLPVHLRPKPEPEPPRRRLKDTDSAATAFRIRSGSWAAAAGGVIGFIIAGAIGFIIGTAIVYVIAIGAAGFLGRAASRLYHASGDTTPVVRQYSLAESLVARGRYAAAADEYRRCVAVYPEDPMPCLHLARLYRDVLHDAESAAEWFRRALRHTSAAPALDVLARRELIEVYLNQLHDADRAVPELTHLAADRFANDAAWARRRLAQLGKSSEDDVGA